MKLLRSRVGLWALPVFLLSSLGLAAEGGLQTAVAVDLLGQVELGKENNTNPAFQVREAELVLYSPVDHLFFGQLNLAAHEDNGQYMVRIHEAFIGSSKLIPRSRFRLGTFLLGVGRLNSFHRHDWPFVSAPRVHSNFFDAEAAFDTGLEYSWLTPLPFYLDVTVGLTSGWYFGHTHTKGSKPLVPTHYLRAVTFAQFTDALGVQFGLNYLGRKDSAGLTTSMVGLDLVAKNRESGSLSWMVQGEIWYRARDTGAATVKELGFYLFPNYYVAKEWAIGLRFDGFQVTNLVNSNFDVAFVPTVTWEPSEFARIRLAYTHERDSQTGRPTDVTNKIETQVVFILGAHPAHDF